jgi:hypothetical protein
MKNFDKDSMGYLLKFARKSKGRPFCAEQVTMSAESEGITSGDKRHWGAVFTQAARDGYIARCDTPFRRVMGNGTITLGWVAI